MTDGDDHNREDTGEACRDGECASGEIVQVRPDWLMTNDISAPSQWTCSRAWVRSACLTERIFILLDHFTPNKDMNAAKVGGKVRRFAQEQNITHFYDAGTASNTWCCRSPG